MKKWICQLLLGHTWKDRPWDAVMSEFKSTGHCNPVRCVRCGKLRPALVPLLHLDPLPNAAELQRRKG